MWALCVSGLDVVGGQGEVTADLVERSGDEGDAYGLGSDACDRGVDESHREAEDWDREVLGCGMAEVEGDEESEQERSGGEDEGSECAELE